MRPASLSLAALAVLATAAPASANEGGLSLFARVDSDRTTVISPRVAAAATLPDDRTTVRGSYMADVWTAASIDIRTAATLRRPRDANAEVRPITEQRDQVDLSAQHEFDDVTIGGSYYYSGENDYWSHGFSLRSVQELGATTLEQSVRYVHDIVSRAGDPSWERPLDTYGLRFVWTQILSPEAIMQAVWEGAYRNGFQSSPYRYVGLGGADGQCGGTALLCVPEVHPSERIRNAFVLRARFAFGQNASAGLGYRFYIDDWGVLSHTAAAQIAWIPERDQTITLRYRFYTQTAAGFYMEQYPVGNIRFVTRDRELSPMFSNRLAASYQARWQLAEGVGLKFAIAIGGTAFVYPEFVGLDEVYALDTTIAFTLEL